MSIDLKVASCFYCQVEKTMFRKKDQHMVEKADPGRDIVRTRAVQIHLDRDLGLYWEGEILRRALAYDDVTGAIHVIPVGQVMAAVARAVEERGGVGPVRDRHGLFKDGIHFNDYGAYLVALTHYAVLYGRTPLGLPHALLAADGTPADDPGAELAALMQTLVWEVVTAYPPSGVRP